MLVVLREVEKKAPGCTPVTFNLTFHPNFHPNSLVFSHLPIYRKLIHDNISLEFMKSKNLLFSIILKETIVCTYKYMHYRDFG